MQDHTLIEYNGFFYKIDKEIDESNDEFYTRCWYIVKKEPKNSNEFINCTTLSKIYRNKQYLNIDYSSFKNITL